MVSIFKSVVFISMVLGWRVAVAAICPEVGGFAMRAPIGVDSDAPARLEGLKLDTVQLSNGRSAVLVKSGENVVRVINEPSAAQVSVAVKSALKIPGVRKAAKSGGVKMGDALVASSVGDCALPGAFEFYNEKWGTLEWQDEMVFPAFWSAFIEQWERDRDFGFLPGKPNSRERLDFCGERVLKLCQDRMGTDLQTDVTACVGGGAAGATAGGAIAVALPPVGGTIAAVSAIAGVACTVGAYRVNRQQRCTNEYIDCVVGQ